MRLKKEELKQIIHEELTKFNKNVNKPGGGGGERQSRSGKRSKRASRTRRTQSVNEMRLGEEWPENWRALHEEFKTEAAGFLNNPKYTGLRALAKLIDNDEYVITAIADAQFDYWRDGNGGHLREDGWCLAIGWALAEDMQLGPRGVKIDGWRDGE